MVLVEHNPHLKHFQCGIYRITYIDNSQYIGTFWDDSVAVTYFGSSDVALQLGLRRSNTVRDSAFNRSQISLFELWYLPNTLRKPFETKFIHGSMVTNGIDPRVLNFIESNSLTDCFLRPNGRLLNCHDNGMQPCNTNSTFDARQEGRRKAGINLNFKLTPEQRSKGVLKTIHALKDMDYYNSLAHTVASIKGALRVAQVRKSSDKYSFSELGLCSLSQKISQQFVDGKIPSISTGFYYQGIIYIVPIGVKSCARKATEITGTYVSQSSLSKSLKRNHGDTLYKGIHFKYASLLTEEELKSAVILK